MTEKQLLQIRQLLKAAEIDCGVLTCAEIQDLMSAVETEAYMQQIKEFTEATKKSLPDGCDETAMDDFYDKDWQITFNGKTVTIHNESTVYNGIVDTLDELIDNCL